jgi:hypothetical protein
MITQRRISVTLGVCFLLIMGAFSSVSAGASLPVQTGQKVRVKTTGWSTPYITGIAVGVHDDTLSIGKAGAISIDRVVTHDSSSIVFAFPGARYDAASDSLSGMTNERETVSVPLSEVSYARVTINVRGKRYTTRFTAATLRRRLQADVAYPELLWRVPADSIGSLQVWHEAHAGTLKAVGAFIGLAVGVAVGESQYKAQEDDFISMPRGVIIVPTAVFCSAIGYFVGKMVAGSDGWREVRLDRRKVELGIGPVTERDLGFRLALKF